MSNLTIVKDQLVKQNVVCFLKDGRLWFHCENEDIFDFVVEALNINPSAAFNAVAYSVVNLQDGEKPSFIGNTEQFYTIDKERLGLLLNDINWKRFETMRETEIFQIVIDYVDLICDTDVGDYLSHQFSSLDWNTSNINIFIEDVVNMVAAKYSVSL